MKLLKLTLALMAMMAFSPTDAKLKLQADVYVFGFSASFSDSTVYFTEVQKLDSAWIETKGKYLVVRDEYARQLRTHFSTTQGNPHRTCVVFYALNQKKAEKLFNKLKSTYTIKSENKFDVRYIKPSEFKFTRVNVNNTEE